MGENRIVVSVSALYQKAKELLNDGMDFAEIYISGADNEIPAALCFDAWQKCDLGAADYGEIEAAQVSP